MGNQTIGERFKNKMKNMDFKAVLKVLTFLWGLALIILMTIVHAELDPEKVNWMEWLSKTILLTGISVFGIVMGEGIGGDKQRAKENGLYQLSIRNHNEIIEKTKPILIYFNDFLLWYKEKETLYRKTNYLTDRNIRQAKLIAKYLKKEDLQEIVNHPIKVNDTIIIDKMSQEQVDIVKEIFDDEMIVKSFSSSYYINTFGEEYKSSELEIGRVLGKKRKNNKRFYRFLKISSSLLISAIWAMATFGDFMDGGDTGAWADLVTRITCLFSCLYSGWLTSIIDVKMESRQIANKTEILNKFKIAYDTEEFKPINYEDLARKHYEEYLSTIEEPKEEIEDENINERR